MVNETVRIPTVNVTLYCPELKSWPPPTEDLSHSYTVALFLPIADPKVANTATVTSFNGG